MQGCLDRQMSCIRQNMFVYTESQQVLCLQSDYKICDKQTLCR